MTNGVDEQKYAFLTTSVSNNCKRSPKIVLLQQIKGLNDHVGGLVRHLLGRFASVSAIAQTSAPSAAMLAGRRAEHTCCQNNLRCDKVNYAAVGALSLLSDIAGVCTGAAVAGLQECHSVDSAPQEITRPS